MAEPVAPMVDKMIAVNEKSQAIGEFLEWLQEEKGYSIRERLTLVEDRPAWDYQVEVTEWLPIKQSIEGLLAEYFEIDLAQVEAEKRAILKYLRHQNVR